MSRTSGRARHADEHRASCGDLWFIPVLQGYTKDEYLRCADLYAAALITM